MPYPYPDDNPLESFLRAGTGGLAPWVAERLKGIATHVGGEWGGVLRSPTAIRLAEQAYPGSGRSVYQTGAEMEQWAAGREQEAEEITKARAERVRAAMGAAAPPEPSTPRGVTGPPISEPPQTGAGAAVLALDMPTQEQAKPLAEPTAHLARLGVDPKFVEQWRAGAGGAGPFRVRPTGGPGKGGFVPSAQPPMVAGMAPEQYEYERARQSPAVQRLMDEAFARASGQRMQAAALEQTQAQAEMARAEAEGARARGELARRQARPLPVQLREQQQALADLQEGVMRNHPMAAGLEAQMMAEWLEQNPEASRDLRQVEQQRERIRGMVAYRLSGEYRDMLHSMDLQYGQSIMRGSAMMPGGAAF